MNKEKVLYRTIIKVEIISESPVDENFCHDLSAIGYEIERGDMTGLVEPEKVNEELVGKAAADAVIRVGTSTDFFFMDEEGNEIE